MGRGNRITMKALFVMSSPFPYGVAFSSRARNLTKLLCDSGFHVHIIAPKSKTNQESRELEGYSYSTDNIYDPQNVLTLSGIGTSKPYINAVEKYLKNNKIDLILSSSMVFVADKLNKISKKIGVPYIIEQCEWYDESTFKFGKYNPYFREHIKRIERKNKQIDGIIAISRLFEEHYRSLGAKTIRIPTILDVKNTVYRVDVKNNYIYKIVFAGSLGKGKENLKPVFEALNLINKDDVKIKFKIYGPSKKQVIENINNNIELWNETKRFVEVCGYIPQDEVAKVISEADFTIFFRPDRRSSNAGFPTKLAESMAGGTPVITNNTGDISLYIDDGKNGFLCDGDDSYIIGKAFENILAMDSHAYMQMRKQARKTAEEYFDYRCYIKEFMEFLNFIQEEK